MKKTIALVTLLLLSGCSHRPASQPQPSTAESPRPELSQTETVTAKAMPDSRTETIEDLWQRIIQGFQLEANANHHDAQRIARQRQFYINQGTFFTLLSERAIPYLHYIVEQAEARDMPLELALLPMVESGFDPFAFSHGQAAGPWQFIPSTGDHFGLTRSWWSDQRRDIIASTDAALSYLQHLARRFDDDWLLALAAYNAGGGNVSRAQRRNREQGLATEYWALQLPTETMNYVPKLLALAQLIQQPEQYGVQLAHIPNRPYFDIVDIGSQLDLSQAAELAGVTEEDLRLLNPAHNRWATDPEGPHRLLIPYDRVQQFKKDLAALPKDQRVTWTRYTIRSGDNLGSIARRFNTSTSVLRDANNLPSSQIIAGRTLLIPSGDDGRSSQLAERTATPVTRTHTVKSGESLWAIARRYDTTVSNLIAINDLAQTTTLQPGQVLRVGTTQETSSRQPSAIDQAMQRRVHYAVRPGDSLSTIASRFNVTVSDIRKWNQELTQRRHLQPGQRLALLVDVRRTY